MKPSFAMSRKTRKLPVYMRNWPFLSFFFFFLHLRLSVAFLRYRHLLANRTGRIKIVSGARHPGASLGVYNLVNSNRLKKKNFLSSFSYSPSWQSFRFARLVVPFIAEMLSC